MVRGAWSGKVGKLGLVLGAVTHMASAQSMGLSASDPVGIGRSGTGVAFGTSLEAATLNPALLVTLREPHSAYLGAGLEVQKSELELRPSGAHFTSSDRNRLLPALGVGWRLGEASALGLKLDRPYLRHREYPLASSARFLGRTIDLNTQRAELQGAWAISPNWSLGVGAGLTQVDYATEVAVVDSTLAERFLRQEGKANAFVYTFGFRWAITPRWTLGGTHQGPIEAAPTWSATSLGEAQNDARPGAGKLVLPARSALGVRGRMNQFFTWEVDLRYVHGSGTKLPSQPFLATPGGAVLPPTLNEEYQDGLGFSVMGEFTLTKRWTARVGAEILPALVKESVASPAVGGSKSAGLSAGVSLKALAGEISFGYQFRQAHSLDSTGLDGVWDGSGFRTTGSTIRTKASGHLLAIGYKRAF